MKGILYLLPNTLGNQDNSTTIPVIINQKIDSIQVFIVEDLRNARRYLKRLNREIVIDDLIFHELNEHTPQEEIPLFLEEAMNGADTAVISEAGVPGVADPGAAVVRIAHEKGIRVILDWSLLHPVVLNGFRTKRTGIHLSWIPSREKT